MKKIINVIKWFLISGCGVFGISMLWKIMVSAGAKWSSLFVSPEACAGGTFVAVIICAVVGVLTSAVTTFFCLD